MNHDEFSALPDSAHPLKQAEAILESLLINPLFPQSAFRILGILQLKKLFILLPQQLLEGRKQLPAPLISIQIRRVFSPAPPPRWWRIRSRRDETAG